MVIYKIKSFGIIVFMQNIKTLGLFRMYCINCNIIAVYYM